MPPKQPPSPIEMKLNAIERTLEVHSTRMDAIDQKLAKIADLVEANTEQVASFSEGLTRLENIVERGFERLEALIAQQLELTKQQNETARMQAGHIDRLTGIVELLIQQRVA